MIQQELVQLAAGFAGNDIDTQCLARVLDDALEECFPRRIVEVNLRCVHLPRIADFLVDDCALAFAKRSLRAMFYDDLRFASTERQADKTEIVETQSRVWCIVIRVRECNGTLEVELV